MFGSSPPARVRLLTLAVVVGIFGAGIAVGIGVEHWRAGADSGGPSRMTPVPMRDLDLSPQQDARIREVFEKYRPQLDAILREGFPKVRAVEEQIANEIRPILTPAQRRKFDEVSKQRPTVPPDGMPPSGPPWQPPGMR